jgi:hypothetical protein
MRASVAAFLLAASVAGVGLLQPKLAQTLHESKLREDVYLFPPPGELRALTLGYHAAATDLIWAKLLVEYGIHWQEKRDFPDLDRYIDAILALEPDFQPLYLLVDTLLVYRPMKGTEIDARHAREYLERGTRERPDDYKVWRHYGDFVAYLAPSWLPDGPEREVWRRDGALAIMHAIQLGSAPSGALAAASVLSRTQELRVKAVDELRHAYVLSDDPEERTAIAAQIARLESDRPGVLPSPEAGQIDMAFIDGRWRKEAPFLDRGTFLLVGPSRDPLRCAGRSKADQPECALEWDPTLPSHRAQ